MCCLRELKDIGFRIGCGFVVGSPYQTPHMLAKELKFIEELQPDMCDIIPFVPHKDTPFSLIPFGIPVADSVFAFFGSADKTEPSAADPLRSSAVLPRTEENAVLRREPMR